MKPKLSFLLTAWKEPETIGRAIESLVVPEYSGYEGSFELLLVAPDEETRLAAQSKVDQLGVSDKYRYFKDDSKGKPIAMNILFKEAQGEYLLSTDGEVYLAEGSVGKMVANLEADPKNGGVSGRPIATNDRSNILGYYAHLQADAVHQMRLDRNKEKSVKFFPMSGYAWIVRNLGFHFPEDLILDDAYITYIVFNKGYEITYASGATIKVKYPTNWSDFISQKMRSLLGFEQLWKYQIIKPETKSRSFWQEVAYFWLPLKYASSPLEFVWSIMYYPLRLYLWGKNRLRRDLAYRAKNVRDIYVRTETTK